ncbi:hypothetical protein ABIA35_007569 [Catenulispora sp. MAP12-49]
MPAAAFVAASVLPHYGRSAPATGVVVLFGLAAGLTVALLIARRRR